MITDITKILPKHYRKFEYDAYSPGRIPLPKNSSPRVYLNFARSDFSESATSRGRVNALANAKRALHFQVDLITNALGINKLHNAKHLSFPQKIAFCRDCGVTSPSILQKLNRVRNKAEHEYSIPTKTQVCDYIDIIELFLAATDRILYQFPEELNCIFNSRTNLSLPDISTILMPIGEGLLYLHYHPGHLTDFDTMNVYDWRKKHSIKIYVKDGFPYYQWVQFLLEKSEKW
jgi:hypothetical protein